MGRYHGIDEGMHSSFEQKISVETGVGMGRSDNPGNEYRGNVGRYKAGDPEGFGCDLEQSKHSTMRDCASTVMFVTTLVSGCGTFG